MSDRKTSLMVQVLRAMAAIAVVLSHLVLFEKKYLPGGTLFPAAFEFGQAGVDLFFVISGYIMTATTINRFGSARFANIFLSRRVLRIYPIYWLYLAIIIIVWIYNPSLMNGNSKTQPDLFASFTLMPHQNGHLLLVSWTLSFEMFFYLVFAALIALLPSRRLGLALLAWAGVTVVGQVLLQPTRHQPLLNLALNPLVLEFIAGAAIALLLPRLSPKWGPWLLGLGFLVLATGTTVLLGQGQAFPVGWARVLIFGSAAALIHTGCVQLEPRLHRFVPGWLVLLGDASYSIYLSHLLTIGVAGMIWRATLASDGVANHLLALGSTLALALLVGVLSYRLVETPMLDWLRARLDPGPRRVARRLPAEAFLAPAQGSENR